jgi:hypothetical protein
MFVVCGRVRVASYPAFARRAEAGLGPLLRRHPGFRGLHCVDCGGGVGIGLLMFETAADADAAREQTARWVEKNLAPLYLDEPQLEAGELVASVHPLAEPADAGDDRGPSARAPAPGGSVPAPDAR